MADVFSFGGASIVAPGFLLSSTISANRILQLLPFGTICMVGASDGGLGSGTVYRFNSISVAKRVLRNGPLLTALQTAASLGGATGFVAVTVGTKAASSAVFPGGSSASATITSGDKGAYTSGFAFKSQTGTSTGFAVTFKYLDANNNVLYIGGPGTKYDNLTTFAQLLAVMQADTLMTPAAATGYLPIFTMTITTAGNLAATSGYVSLTGGTGSGSSALVFADYKLGIDALIDVPFDLGHLVGAYDSTSQAYADGQAQQLYTLGLIRSWVHQVSTVGSASPSQTKVQNSLAVSNALVAAATAMNSKRSSFVAQQVKALNVETGATSLVDGAWVYIGDAALTGATGPNGPATPLTYDYPSVVADVDYQIMRTTGDLDAAITGGGVVFERVNYNGYGSVRIVQSVTSQPNDANGNPWYYAEFSVVRGSDALQANVKAALETAFPKVIGAGATVPSLTYALGIVAKILALAFTNNWITAYDLASISITPTGTTGNDFIVNYGASPVLPINHMGIAQTLEPFQVPVSLGGTVNG